MAFTFRAVATTSSGASPRTVTKPTGTAEGDLLVLQVSSSGSDVTPTPPMDFVEIVPARNTTVPTVRVFWKMAGPSEPADYTVTFPSGSGHTVGLAAWTPGAGNAADVDAATTRSNGAGNRIFDEVTTTVANDLLACFGALGNIGSTPDAAMTERWDTGASPRIYLMSQSFVGPGATGTRTATGTASANQASTVAFKEVAASPPSAPHDLEATAQGTSSILLEWDDDNVTEDIDGFSIEQSLSAESGFSEIDTTANDELSYLVEGLNPATTYYFRVRAFRDD